MVHTPYGAYGPHGAIVAHGSGGAFCAHGAYKNALPFILSELQSEALTRTQKIGEFVGIQI